MALTDNLIAYYKFDGNSNDSVGSNNGSDTSITYSAGKIGDAAFFDGSSSRISLSSAASLASSFTVAGWARTTTTAAYRTIYSSGTALNFWRVGIDNTGKLTFTEDNIADYMGTTSMSTNTWTYFAFVKDGTGASNLTFYFNGTSDGTASVSTTTVPSGGALFGAQGSSPANFWSGGIDEVGLWDRALSGAEITQLYNGGSGLTYPFASGPTNVKTVNGVDAQ